MSLPPRLQTARLFLRPFEPADAPAVARIVGDFEVARMTASLPHPYPEGAALAWIATHRERHAAGAATTWAVALDGALVAAVGLEHDRAHRKAELGYWVARERWGRGIASEAAAAVVAHAFGPLALDRLEARVMTRNPASARVLVRLGFAREGVQRAALLRFGERVDLELYGLLRPGRPVTA